MLLTIPVQCSASVCGTSCPRHRLLSHANVNECGILKTNKRPNQDDRIVTISSSSAYISQAQAAKKNSSRRHKDGTPTSKKRRSPTSTDAEEPDGPRKAFSPSAAKSRSPQPKKRSASLSGSRRSSTSKQMSKVNGVVVHRKRKKSEDAALDGTVADVGKVVAKLFVEGIFTGEVVKVSTDPPLWTIR